MNKHALFNVLKYPISELPTASELEALPEELYLAWRDACRQRMGLGLMLGYVQQQPATVAVNFRLRTGAYLEAAYADTALLRKMIAEYEPV